MFCLMVAFVLPFQDLFEFSFVFMIPFYLSMIFNKSSLRHYLCYINQLNLLKYSNDCDIINQIQLAKFEYFQTIIQHNSQSMHQEDQIQKFICENTTFKNIPQIIKEIIEKSKEIQAKLKNKEWYICDGGYQKYNWKEMFLYMSECLAEQLILQRNKRVHIISQIQYVQYSNLRSLSLYSNKINNIQSLSSIHFNCLQVLGLSQNQISQIKCFNKLSTPSLNQIFLGQNPLIDINALTKSKFNSKLLAHLELQFQLNSDPINQDLSVFVKMNSKSIEYIYKQSKKRFNQVKVQSMLKLRFPSIYIWK